jgi:hypothetical protein
MKERQGVCLFATGLKKGKNIFSAGLAEKRRQNHFFLVGRSREEQVLRVVSEVEERFHSVRQPEGEEDEVAGSEEDEVADSEDEVTDSEEDEVAGGG